MIKGNDGRSCSKEEKNIRVSSDYLHLLARVAAVNLSAMPRPLRIQYEGALHRLMSRGDRRQTIFADDADRHAFLELLG